jgi:uncharacterized protein
MADPIGFVGRTFRKAMAALAGIQFGGARDLYETFGYPRAVGTELYLALYTRQDIAGRIVDAYPDATWREPPRVCKKVEKKKPKTKGGAPSEEKDAFEKAVETLAEQFDLWGTMQRLDRLTGVGHYGVLMFGLDGGEELTQPTGKRYKLLYLTPHGEPSAQITRWVSNPKDPRYAQPETYRLTSGVAWTGSGSGRRDLEVHHSRTLHIAERQMQDKTIGTPRLERIVNRLFDLEKLLGGSAEVYWQNAAALRAWIADADAQWDPAEAAEMKTQIEDLQNGLRRDVRLRGVTPQLLAANANQADASSNIDKQLDFISGATGIPKRILIGSERGELSSEQDENNWAGRVQERRQQYATPHMVRPLIQRFIELGILPDPGGEFEVIWPESDTLGEQARADIAAKKASAVSSYVNAMGSDSVIAPQEFRMWLGEDPESDYELAEPPEPVETNPDGSTDDLDKDPQGVLQYNRRLAMIANAAPRTLYVRRNVLNWKEIAAWAKSQGFATTVGEAMHVTIAFSRQPVDWMKVTDSWVPHDPDDLTGGMNIVAGGPRMVETLGPQGAVVLMFTSSDLSWRHRSILDCGASWDFHDYQPHITISYETAPDLATVEPYRGAIELGPEIFEEVDDDYRSRLIENRVHA